MIFYRFHGKKEMYIRAYIKISKRDFEKQSLERRWYSSHVKGPKESNFLTWPGVTRSSGVYTCEVDQKFGLNSESVTVTESVYTYSYSSR